MEIQVFALAEGVDRGSNGAMTIFRVLDSAWVQNFPAVVRLTLALVFDVSRSDDGKKRVLLRQQPSDGTAETLLDFELNVMIEKGRHHSGVHHFCPIDVAVRRPGDVALILEIDGVLKRTIHFTVLEMAA